MRLLAAWIVGACLACLPACRTNVALVDNAWGSELLRQGRLAHVRTARTPIAKDSDGYRFTLDVVFENDTDAPWSVLSADIAVRDLGKPAETVGLTPRIDLPSDAVLVTIPARDDAAVRVPIHIGVPPGTTPIALEQLPLEISIAHKGDLLLRRRVVAGSYSQIGQGVRVVLLATAGLVLLSLL
jgi:hypothetical protein